MRRQRRRLLVWRKVRQLAANPEALLAVGLAHGVRGVVAEAPGGARGGAGGAGEHGQLGVHPRHAKLFG